MLLVSFKDVSLNIVGNIIYDKINCQINSSEKIVLIGRNGSGKSTFLNLINKTVEPDSGKISIAKEIKISYLHQNVPQSSDKTIHSIVMQGVGEIGILLKEYAKLTKKLANNHSQSLLNKLEIVSNKIEIKKGWEIDKRVNELLKSFELDKNTVFSTLSAGKKRLILFIRAIVSNPDLLLLDEPTNHLDIEMIVRLEEFIKNYSGTVLFVTHDRKLIEKTATRIMELDRGKLNIWNCEYEKYLERKKDLLTIEEKKRIDFLKKLSDEEIWIRKGIKARRTRNEGRVKKLKLMREERLKMRASLKNAEFAIQESNSSGKIVIKAKKVSFKYKDKLIINDFSTLITRGDRIGIIGNNGTGKTTLLNILLKRLKPLEGTVEHGTNLEIKYFDQLKASLDESRTIINNVGDGNELLKIGSKTMHIIPYLQDFLFSPERSKTKVSVLSGGEKSRVVLAKLFTIPSNLIVMDEPTNDLDIETLELLEELLSEYKGTLLIVSHDRSFLNNIATSILVFQENGVIKEYIGGYNEVLKNAELNESREQKQDQRKKNKKEKKITKLSYKEQNELDELPLKIEKLEEKKEDILKEMSNPEFYKESGEYIGEVKKKLSNINLELNERYQRWEDLEEKESIFNSLKR